MCMVLRTVKCLSLALPAGSVKRRTSPNSRCWQSDQDEQKLEGFVTVNSVTRDDEAVEFDVVIVGAGIGGLPLSTNCVPMG